MENQIAVLLATHGGFAKAALESAELIAGKQENVDTLSVFLVDDLESLKKEMFEKVDNLDTSKGLIILTDIAGGTPTNLTSYLLTNENRILCSGLNLPVLLEVLMNRGNDFQNVREVVENAYAQGLTIRTYEDMNRKDDEDDLL